MIRPLRSGSLIHGLADGLNSLGQASFGRYAPESGLIVLTSRLLFLTLSSHLSDYEFPDNPSLWYIVSTVTLIAPAMLRDHHRQSIGHCHGPQACCHSRRRCRGLLGPHGGG